LPYNSAQKPGTGCWFLHDSERMTKREKENKRKKKRKKSR
jgi:hypothetical protein